MNHLHQDEDVAKVMSDLLGDELHKVRHQLMQARVVFEAGEGCHAHIVVVAIKDGGADPFKVELELLRHHVLDERPDRHVVRRGETRHMRAGTFRAEILTARLGRGRILGNGRLNTLESGVVR